jgi:hypothetical protein
MNNRQYSEESKLNNNYSILDSIDKYNSNNNILCTNINNNQTISVLFNAMSVNKNKLIKNIIDDNSRNGIERNFR